MRAVLRIFTAHARNGHISISGLKSDVTNVFLDPDFLFDAENFGDSAIYKGNIAYFVLRMRKTAICSLPVYDLTSPSCSTTPIT